MRVPTACLGLALFAPAAPAGIVASVAGSNTPALGPPGSTVTNGGFTITTLPGFGGDVGDGVEDVTTATFDFTADPGFPAFDPGAPLASAVLTLSLRPTNEFISTDTVAVGGLPEVFTPVVQTLPFDGRVYTVSFDLLAFYSPADLLAAFAAGNGTLAFYYQDDSVVSAASLELTPAAAVPAPPAVGLAVAGAAVGLGAARRRRG